MVILSPKRLRDLRKRRKKKQSEIAQIMGVKRPTYVGYEKKDTIEVTPEVAESVAKFLQVDVLALQSHEKVEQDDLAIGEARHMITHGDYVGLHKKAWEEFQKTLEHNRKVITEITSTNSELGKGILELMTHLTKMPSDQKT